MRTLLFMGLILSASSAHALCPKDSTMMNIFEHLEQGAKFNLDGQVWEVEHVMTAPNFSESRLVTVVGTAYLSAGRGENCSYDALDQGGGKRSITIGSRQKMPF